MESGLRPEVAKMRSESTFKASDSVNANRTGFFVTLWSTTTTILLYANSRPQHSVWPFTCVFTMWPFTCVFTVVQEKRTRQHQLLLKSRLGFHFFVTWSIHELIRKPARLIYTGWQEQRWRLQLFPEAQSNPAVPAALLISATTARSRTHLNEGAVQVTHR